MSTPEGFTIAVTDQALEELRAQKAVRLNPRRLALDSLAGIVGVELPTDVILRIRASDSKDKDPGGRLITNDTHPLTLDTSVRQLRELEEEPTFTVSISDWQSRAAILGGVTTGLFRDERFAGRRRQQERAALKTVLLETATGFSQPPVAILGLTRFLANVAKQQFRELDADVRIQAIARSDHELPLKPTFRAKG